MTRARRKRSYTGLVPPGIPLRRTVSCPGGFGTLWNLCCPLVRIRAVGDVSKTPFLLVSSPGVYSQVCPGFLERLLLSVRAEMSLPGDEWVQEGVAASPAWGTSTHVTSWLCKNWATFGQGGEVLAKAVSLLTDSYLLHGGKTTIRRSICAALEDVDGLFSCQWPSVC